MSNLPWTKDELKILRDAWVRGMTAKSISLMILKHRTVYAIRTAMRRNGLKFKGNSNWKSEITLHLGICKELHEQLKSSAIAQGVTLGMLCREILQNEMRGLDVRRTAESEAEAALERISRQREYKRKWMLEWRERQRQESAAK